MKKCLLFENIFLKFRFVIELVDDDYIGYFIFKTIIIYIQVINFSVLKP